MKLEVEIDDKKIKAAITKAGKIDVNDLEYMARHIVHDKVKKELRKIMPSGIEKLVKDTVKEMDWNKIVLGIVESLVQDDYF